MVALNFDASQHDPMQERGIIPPGEYVAVIVDTEAKAANSGKGDYLNVEFDIIDGQFQGRKAWTILNLWNANETARSIAHQELKSICDAIGLPGVTDSAELHGRPIVIKLEVEDDNRDKHLPADQRRKRNTVKGYKPASGGAVVQSRPQTPQAGYNSGHAPAQAPQQQAAAVPPWKRGAA